MEPGNPVEFYYEFCRESAKQQNVEMLMTFRSKYESTGQDIYLEGRRINEDDFAFVCQLRKTPPIVNTALAELARKVMQDAKR